MTDSVDADFGDNTKAAVMDYQDDHDLSVDGIVGLNTWTELEGELYGTSTRNILRKSDSVDIGVYDTFKVAGASNTTDCIFGNIPIHSESKFYNKWLCDNNYTGHGLNGSYTLSNYARVMNTSTRVNNY